MKKERFNEIALSVLNQMISYKGISKSDFQTLLLNNSSIGIVEGPEFLNKLFPEETEDKTH